MAGRKPTVLVVDDHPLWRQTLRRVIEESGVANQVVEAGDGVEAVAEVRARKPEVVVMDMALPGLHGIDATGEIVGVSPGTRVLVLSSSDDEEQTVLTGRTINGLIWTMGGKISNAVLQLVVLGILAGIVVFGVGTFRADANTAACKADQKTVSVAADAVDARRPAAPADEDDRPGAARRRAGDGCGDERRGRG